MRWLFFFFFFFSVSLPDFAWVLGLCLDLGLVLSIHHRPWWGALIPLEWHMQEEAAAAAKDDTRGALTSFILPWHDMRMGWSSFDIICSPQDRRRKAEEEEEKELRTTRKSWRFTVKCALSLSFYLHSSIGLFFLVVSPGIVIINLGMPNIIIVCLGSYFIVLNIFSTLCYYYATKNFAVTHLHLHHFICVVSPVPLFLSRSSFIWPTIVRPQPTPCSKLKAPWILVAQLST